ncbi:MAG: M1 family aminopeptidase [Saprospiraceae bacterium]
MKQYYLPALLFFFWTVAAMAQPTRPAHHGCHWAQHDLPLRQLTPDEAAALIVSQTRSDSIDILDYFIDLDITDFTNRRIAGACTLELRMIEPATQAIVLDLLQLTIDSLHADGQPVLYTYDGNQIHIPVPVGWDTESNHTVTVFYRGTPTVAAGGFGGLAFQDGIAYNLGIGLGENPYNYGRSWFPCFDNFVERSTYTIAIQSNNGRFAYCSGHFVSQEVLEEVDKIRRTYRIDQPMTTYLVGVAVSNYTTVESSHQGAFGNYPIQLVGRPEEIGDMDNSFLYLPECIDMLEHWYGPYAWGRIGFVLTPVGAMEHVHNIAFPIATGTSGPNFGMNRLMAHEFAHQWWGNITTLSSPADMWIKEGNAEYGAHLFTEYVFGREAFLEQVRNNHLDVLRNAHIDDGSYLPLSGLPYENTYGTHTYYKGASMLHNMRTYLGDSLFRAAQQAVLEHYAFADMNAPEYRDYLSLVSGIDMGPFFQDWILSPGYSDFEIDTWSVSPAGNQFQVDLTLQQKLHEAPQFHTAVPVHVTFLGQQWQQQTVRLYCDGELTTHSLTLDFAPVSAVINMQQELNMGRMNLVEKVTATGGLNAGRVDFFTLSVDALQDSALVNITHHYTAPDPSGWPAEAIEMSSDQFWTVAGIFPDVFQLKGIIRLNGNSAQADYNLIQNGRSTIRLMYRPTPESEWAPYEQATVSNFGAGILARIDHLLPGDYAFANVYQNVANEAPAIFSHIVLSPNPAADHALLTVQVEEAPLGMEMQLFDLQGRLVQQSTLPAATFLQHEIDTSRLPAGVYVVLVSTEKGYQAMELVVEK